MSRGFGSMQRFLLAQLAPLQADSWLEVHIEGGSEAANRSLRRAVRRLEGSGLIEVQTRLIRGHRRLIVAPTALEPGHPTTARIPALVR